MIVFHDDNLTFYNNYRKEIQRKMKEQERIEKEEQAQRQYGRKIDEEYRRREQAEQMIEILQAQEKQLIEKLQQSQAMQQEVCCHFLPIIRLALTTLFLLKSSGFFYITTFFKVLRI